MPAREHVFKLRAVNLARRQTSRVSVSVGLDDDDGAPPQSFRALSAEAAFEAAMPVKTTQGEKLLYVARVQVGEARVERSAANVPHLGHGVISACTTSECPALLIADVSVMLPQALFEAAWKQQAGEDHLLLTLAFPASEDPPVLDMTLGYQSEPVRFTVEAVECRSSSSADRHWTQERRARHIVGALERLYYNGAWGNQVGQVCQELACGLARIEDAAERAERVQQVLELVADARRVFREPLTGTGQEFGDNAYALDKEGFDAFIAQYDEKRQRDMRSDYCTLWQHFRVADALSHGEAAAGPAHKRMRCTVTELEELASRYAALGLQSPLLEWALLDALVYAECVALAQVVVTENVMWGIQIPQPLPAQSVWRQFTKEARKWAAHSVSEVVKMSLTFAVAWVLTQENPVATWVVFTGYTFFRWQRRLKFLREFEPKVRMGELLTKMGWISESLARRDFNAQGERQYIRSLTAEGVSFSPWVLNLLDRRIDLESKANPAEPRLSLS